MAVTKIYKGNIVRDDIVKIYKGNELIYEAAPPEPPTNVVRFVSDSPRTITPKYTNSDITLQYSIDSGTTWTNISSEGTTASSDEIWFRGRATGTKTLYTTSTSSNAWAFSGESSNKLHVYGDLRYLLCDNLGDNTITFNIASYCFSYMFYYCRSLTTAPSLPATTLANYCYYYMFAGCTSLTTAPSLPATTLSTTGLNGYDCYSYMFNGCTSLTTAPNLPATTLSYRCYYAMFRGCTSLTTAPSLPARTVGNSCYSYMFYGCTSLTTAPNLPATTLGNSCYSYMFSGCTSLTTAPYLRATTLTSYCYDHMFSGCTSFKISEIETESCQYSWRIPMIGTGTVASYWNHYMVENTGGPYTGYTLSLNKTYYVENPPV